ncbi:M6 family metalloprotease domain-containing protein [Sulfurimonas sp. MAG313]|nr:M6 family metalloprotease domain-containing protein [Sulfurimonas sp. MAG313]MDF1881562.1 M6 family metalloprotease domain-containing protein [Sulfurimonas sp. MAG313]
MKIFLSILLIFFTLSCGGGGGNSNVLDVQLSDVDTGVIEPPEPPIVIPDEIVITEVKVPLLIIQVEFTDYSFNSSTQVWNQKLFGTQTGELNNYFLEISQNTFMFEAAKETEGTTNDGIIRVSLNFKHPDSGTDNFQAIAIPAIEMADAYINFAQYDINKNKRIETKELQIMFLVAGGENATGIHPSIWAHQFYIENVNLDDVSLMQVNGGSYTAFGERHFSITGTDASIGIIAHELGHGVFNLEDLYDFDGSSEGIGNFGLMGSGSWGLKNDEYPGETPVHMIAWSKIKSKFLLSKQISTTTNNLQVQGTTSSTYQPIRINTQRAGEYFLLEYRAPLGYDQGLFILEDKVFPGGLAIWHIDENQNDNSQDNSRLVDLVEADGFHLDTAGNQGLINNLFFSDNPSANYLGEISNTSTPDTSNLNSGANTNISIKNISTTSTVANVDIELQ